MAKKMRVKAKLKAGITTVKVLINHPMETGQRKDKKTGKLIPANFIQEVTCTLGDKTIMTARWGSGVSKNPYLAFRFKGANVGDKCTLAWKSNIGESDSIEVAIK